MSRANPASALADDGGESFLTSYPVTPAAARSDPASKDRQEVPELAARVHAWLRCS